MLAKLRAGVKYDVAFPEAQTAAQLVQAKLPRAARSREPPELVAGQLGLPQPVVRRGRQVHGALRDLDDRHRLPHRQGQGHDGVVERPLEPPRGGQAHVPARRLPRGPRHGPARDRHEGRQLQRARRAVGKAQAEILKLKPRLRGFTSLNTRDGERHELADAHVVGHGLPGAARQKHPELLKYQINKEGIPVGSDTMVVLKNAPHPNTAQLFIDYMLRPENSSANVKIIGYPMMTTSGLKTYGELTKKYPWLKVTTDEVENGQKLQAAGSQDPAALEHRLVEDPGVRQASPGAARPLVGIPRTAGPLARRAVPGPAGPDRRGLVRLGRLPRPGDLRLAVQRLGPEQLPHGPDRRRISRRSSARSGSPP